jgi:serine/threonine protein kinase/WD40 repeat protein/tetratricopeptide (TPR) repeat protein
MTSAERNPIDELAEEFAERFRRGERPPLSEYIRRHPELEEEIREVFPALVMMEQLKPATSDEVPAVSGENLPASIGDYRLLREIGRGGMGIVYEAEQVSLGRHVALKVFPTTGLTNPTYLERFRREAKAAARLHHTNIVPVFGVGESGGIHYYAMQFIHGEGMDKVLADLRRLRPHFARHPADGAAGAAEQGSVAHSLLSGKFAVPLATQAAPPWAVSISAAKKPGTASSATLSLSLKGALAHSAGNQPTEGPVKADISAVTLSGNKSGSEYHRSVARIGLQIAEALAYAHKQGILHRDIKPSNLILDLQGTAWITDFGLAKAEGADELTHTGDVVGTIRYMPPERFEGTSLPQGDIYAVGMTLYEMLTLRPAFDDANHARLIQRIGDSVPPRPRKLLPDIPRDLETVVLKAGARDPADRYATAEALAEDLQRFLSDRPIRARRHAAAERLWRWCRRNPALATLTGISAVLLIAVAIISSFAALSLSASKRDTLEQLWHAKLSEARATVLSQQRGQRFTSLKRIREAMALATQLGMTEQDRLELRNAAIGAMALPDLEVAKEWDGYPEGTVGVSFDAALERYVRSDLSGNISIRRVSDDREQFALPNFGRPATVRLSPSGRYLVVCGNDHPLGTTINRPLQLWDLDAREPRCVYEGSALTSVLTDFSPDEALLACQLSTRLSIVDVASKQERALWPLPGSGMGDIRWSPNGNRLAVGRWVNGRTLVEVRDAAAGAVLASLWHDGDCSGFGWHPDGRFLAVGAGAKIHIWDVPARTRLAVLEGHKAGGVQVAFNRAGDRLISTDWNGTVRLWDLASGRQLLSIQGIGFPAFGRDDRSLACTGPPGSGKLQILRFAPGREVRTLAGRVGNPDPESVVLSRNSQLVAIGTWDPVTWAAKGTAVLDRRTGRELGRLSAVSQLPLGFGQDGSLWTFDTAGNVLHWPCQAASPGGTSPLGPPQPVVSMPGTEGRAMTADGSRLVLTAPHSGAGGLLWRHDARDRLIPLGAQEDVRYAALSSNGRWVATGSHWRYGVKVCDAATGRLEKQFTDIHGFVKFSPDSRWLLAYWAGGKLWRTDTWEERPLPYIQGDIGTSTFSPDSRLLARGGLGRVRLVRLDTGAEVARLPFAEQTNLKPLAFTADGAELLVWGEDTLGIHIWDLRLIRAQLAELELDWDDPPLPPAPEKPGVPRAVEFVGADLVADAQKLWQYRKTLNLLTLSANPFDAHAHFRLAQMTGNPSVALAHYTASLAFDPQQPLAYENRAVEAYKLKRWQQVIEDTGQVLKDQPDRPPARWNRALAQQKLGQHAQAVADFTAVLPASPDRSALYELRAQSYAALGDNARAAGDRRKALDLDPDNPVRLNKEAWRLLTGPASERDAALALKLAQRATKLAPNEAMHVNTLGVAQYRNRQYREALATLERSLALSNGKWDAFDLFFLAMCHQKLGEPKKARDCYDAAVRWVIARKSLDRRLAEELRAFQAEADAELKSSALGTGPKKN